MQLLVLGGTKFLGRAVVEAALAGGHTVTLFHRGRTNPGLFPDAEHLLGDREGPLDPLRGRRWDAAIDVSGYLPRVVRAAAECLRDTVSHYTFVSSISVYRRLVQPGATEDTPAHAPPDPPSEDVRAHYGALKAMCEGVVAEVFAGRSLVVRPGLIVGPHDPSGRFSWWIQRMTREGPVLVPGPAERPIQVVDARDLGAWMVRAAEARLTGTYNATGPGVPFRDLLATGRATPVWVDEGFLLEREVGPWMEVPLWSPMGDPDFAAVHEVDSSRAVAAGLRYRSIGETAHDTLAWLRSLPELPREMGPTGLDPGREAELLAQWRDWLTT